LDSDNTKQNLIDEMVSVFNNKEDESPMPNRKDNRAIGLFEKHLESFDHAFYQDDEQYDSFVLLALSIFAAVAEAIHNEANKEIELVTDVTISTVDDIGIENIENLEIGESYDAGIPYIFKKIVNAHTNGNLIVNISEESDWIMGEQTFDMSKVVSEVADKIEDD